MYCAECGKPLVNDDQGAWLQCCNGAGYWSEEVPEMKLTGQVRHKHLYLYLARWWPENKKAVRPRI